MKSTTETELKFDCGPEFRLPAFDGLITVSDHEFRLTANYWDTTDRRLLARGITLRHRCASDSSEEGWTLKLTSAKPAGGDQRGAAVVRDELSEPGPPETPPERLLALVRAVTLEHPMVPIATIVTHRRLVELGTDFGHAGVEVADDDVVSRVGDVVGPGFRQIEVELIDRSAIDLLDTVAGVVRAAGLRPSRHASKLERVTEPTAVGRHAARRLHPDSTTVEVVRHLLTRSTDQLIANDPGVRLGDDAEAVHQARVATRRLRAELKLLEPALDPAVADALRTDLRWLGGQLGDLRDSQVLAMRLEAEIDSGARQGRPSC